MKPAFLENDDLTWLLETHLLGVTLPSKWVGFKSAIMQGNEYSPYAINLYLNEKPEFNDNYLRVTFDHAPPIYCEYQEYNGFTDKPMGEK